MHLVPHRLVDDAKLRDVVHDPEIFGIGTGKAFACAWVPHVALLVPDQPASVELVVENAGAAREMAADRRISPRPSAGAGQSFEVEVACNRPRRLAGAVVGEDATDDGRLGIVDRPAAMQGITQGVRLLNDVVAVAKPTPRATLADAAFEAAPGLLAEILEEESVHRALEADVELADLALCQGDHRHASKGEVLVEPGDVLLVAREAIKRFGDDDLEAAGTRILEELLVARPHANGATHGMIGVDTGRGPLLRIDACLAETNLVLDRGVPLKLAAIAGVDGGAHQALSLGLLVASACSLRNPARKSATISFCTREAILLVPWM